MNIAVIGTGNIGGRLARRLASHGVTVTVAGRDQAKVAEFAQSAGPNVSASSVPDAIAGNQLIVFATMFPQTQELLTQYADALHGKTVIDPSNNISFNAAGEAVNENPDGVSAGQQLAALIPDDAHYVKAFGSMSAAELEETDVSPGQPVTMFYATDDAPAGDEVARVISAGGWAPVQVGGVDDTARTEVFGDLHPFGGLNGRLLTRDEARDLI